jgi:hypothetical protein
MTWLDDFLDIFLLAFICVMIFFGGRFYAQEAFLTQCQHGQVTVLGHQFDVIRREQ